MKYCKFCGNQVMDEAVMCTACGKSLIPEYTVTVERESQFYIGKMVIKLEVDGGKTYSFNNGESLELTLPSGRHSFYFHFSFRSKTVIVDLQHDTTLLLSWDRFSGGISVYEKQ